MLQLNSTVTVHIGLENVQAYWSKTIYSNMKAHCAMSVLVIKNIRSVFLVSVLVYQYYTMIQYLKKMTVRVAAPSLHIGFIN